MAQVVVRVLASADPSLRNVFDNFRSLAKRAGDAVKRDGDTVAKQRVKSEEQITKAAEREQQKRTKTALREEQKRSSEAAKTQAKATKDFEREEQRRTRIVRSEEKARVREQERGQRQTKRDNAQIVRDTMSGYNRISTVAGNAFGNMTKIAKTAVGVVTGFAGAIGIDTSISSINQKGMGFEKAIVDVTNSGTKGVASKQDIGRTKSAVEGASDATKTDQNAMADALGKYVGLTGDLNSGMASLEMFGKLARATGADVGDLAGAAGQIANGLGDVPNKAALVAEALRIVAEQGRLGSVEIKDLAQYMGKFASKAQFFEGTRQDAMASLGALAQISMKGGRSTGAEAATSAGNFNGEITSKAADKAFAKYKVERFGKGGRLRDAGEIVLDAIKATKGDGRKLQEMFSQKASRAAATGLAGTYNAAGGGAAGEAAARAELNKYRGSVSEADVEGRAQNSMNTGEARATDLNNRIQRKVSTMVEGLMPAFEKMIPSLESMANSLIKAAPAIANFTKFLVDNPAVAITGAIVGSIGKAAIGEAIKGSLLNLLNGLKPPVPGAPPIPGAPGGGGSGLLDSAPVLLSGADAVMQGEATIKLVKDAIASLEPGALKDAASKNAAEAGKGDNKALYALYDNIGKMEVLGRHAGAGMPVSDADKPAWEAELARLKVQRDAAMNKLSPSDQAQMIGARLAGSSDLVPKGDYKPDANNGAGIKALQDAAVTLKSAGLSEAAATLVAAANALSIAAGNMGGGGVQGRVPGGPT